MDEVLGRLAAKLHPEVDEGLLLDALHLIRAPRRPTGIIPATRQFRDWRSHYPMLNDFPGRLGYANALRVLDAIADLDESDPDLSGKVLKHRPSAAWTPLRPYTGDSVICELLLVQAGGHASSMFEELSVWLVWQLLRFQAQQVRRSAYEQYLSAPAGSLKDLPAGNRPYAAYLALRRLLVESQGMWRLQELAKLLQPDDATSILLTAFVRIARHKVPPKILQYAAARTGDDTSAVVARAKEIERLLPGEFSLLLRTVWDPELEIRSGVTGARRGGNRGVSCRPTVTHGPRLTEILQRVEEDDIHAGVVVDFFTRGTGSAPLRAPPDDDPEQLPEQPAFSFFLGASNNLLQAHYASKSIQHAIEYENARLLWCKTTLSSTALVAVEAMVSGSGGTNADPLDLEARFAIGLSLLSGRALDETVGVSIVDSLADWPRGAQMLVTKNDHHLHVLAGKPDLRSTPNDAQPFCLPTGSVISLGLPVTWGSLVAQMRYPRNHKRNDIQARALRLLRGLPAELSISAKGIRGALLRALDLLTRGDLGVLAAVTAGAEANSRNVIHYASYPRGELERLWRAAAEQLVTGCLVSQNKDHSPVWVGAQHAFELNSLANYISELIQRRRDAEASGAWFRVFNLSVLYLSLWLGVGLAQRRTLRPIPTIIIDGDWAVVLDKRRSDGSTDRLVPITSGLRRQINEYVALASQLSLVMPDLDPVIKTERGTELRLQYLLPHPASGKMQVTSYAPKVQEQSEHLKSLPANWGRKVARTLSDRLPGRYRDAGLGHFVRGRDQSRSLWKGLA